MERTDSLLQLKQAGELAFMLEQMAGSFAKIQGSDSRQVWAGVSLTLRQIGKSIESVQDELSGKSGLFSGSSSEVNRRVSDTPLNGGSSIAGRVQKAPISGGRVRELVDHQRGDLVRTGADDYLERTSSPTTEY